MEEKKFDSKTIIGFALIAVIMIWMLYNNSPTQEEIEAEKARTEQLANQEKTEKAIQVDTVTKKDVSQLNPQDSLAFSQLQNELGSFAYSATLSSAIEKETVLENDKLYLKINNKGGYVSEVQVKGEVDYKGDPIYLIKEDNASLGLQFTS